MHKPYNILNIFVTITTKRLIKGKTKVTCIIYILASIHILICINLSGILFEFLNDPSVKAVFIPFQLSQQF